MMAGSKLLDDLKVSLTVRLRLNIEVVLHAIASDLHRLQAAGDSSETERLIEPISHDRALVWKRRPQAAQDGDLDLCVAVLADLADMAIFRIERLLANSACSDDWSDWTVH